MKKYRVEVTMIERGYVDVEASDKGEAVSKAYGEIEMGGFIGINSEAQVGEVVEED